MQIEANCYRVLFTIYLTFQSLVKISTRAFRIFITFTLYLHACCTMNWYECSYSNRYWRHRAALHFVNAKLRRKFRFCLDGFARSLLNPLQVREQSRYRREHLTHLPCICTRVWH